MTDIDKIQPDLPHVVIGPVISSGNAAVVVNKCEECPNAVWDYETYYGSTQKDWFIDGCKKDLTPEDCEDEDE